MTDHQFWGIVVGIWAAVFILERIEKQLVAIHRILKFGKDAD